MAKNSILVSFSNSLPENWDNFGVKTICSKDLFKEEIEKKGFEFIAFDNLIEPGSIYEATEFSEELSKLRLPDKTKVTKSVNYKGYELWWFYYNSVFLYFSLPYTQYRKLLVFLKNYTDVFFYEPPFKTLFAYYLKAYGVNSHILNSGRNRLKSSKLPFGIFIQILLSLVFLPALILRRPKIMIFVGDKFETGQDFDFRMKYIYQELRKRGLAFMEVVRSLETWKAVLGHVMVRKRAVLYSEGMIFLGRFFNFLTFKKNKIANIFKEDSLLKIDEPEARFKLMLSAHYLLEAESDIWTIRIIKVLLKLIGVKAAYITAAAERNFHTFLACKLNGIPTVGILHGVASRYYNIYDFLPGYDGDKLLSVDKYGLWSSWWKEYYEKNSLAYRADQLYVSGPMRPLERVAEENMSESDNKRSEKIKVLFISEQLAVPNEVIPYLETLLHDSNIEVTFSFRHYRDGFKDWLSVNRPDILNNKIKIAEGGLHEAIKNSHVVVGSHSTAVLEALFKYRVPLFFNTNKWGDYYSLLEYGKNHPFYAGNTEEFLEKIHNAISVSRDDLSNLRERYFGDPYRNGSAWVVDQLEEYLSGLSTK